MYSIVCCVLPVHEDIAYSFWFYLAEMEIHQRKDDGKIKPQKNIDCHGPRPISIGCHLPDPPFLSLQTTFKVIFLPCLIEWVILKTPTSCLLSMNMTVTSWKDLLFYSVNLYFLCTFAVYYLRYAVRSFFTLSRISLADGKRAGQKIQRKIAAAVQKVKSPVLFVPLF